MRTGATGMALPVPFPGPPRIPEPQRSPSGLETRSARVVAARKPQPLAGLHAVLCLEILTARQLPYAKWSLGASPHLLHPLSLGCALPTLLAELGAHPCPTPRLPSAWRVGPVLWGRTRNCRPKFLSAPPLGGSIDLGLDSPALCRVIGVGLLTLIVTFPINGTKKLQRAAKRKRGARKGGERAFLPACKSEI